MTDDVIPLGAHRADRAWDNTLVSPEECCIDAAQDLRSGRRNADSCIILFLNTGEGGDKYGVGWSVSNLRCSEAIALMEAAKVHFFAQMGLLQE